MSNQRESTNRIDIPAEQFLKPKRGELGCIFFLSKKETHKIQFDLLKVDLKITGYCLY
jgi:hypothetical protein